MVSKNHRGSFQGPVRPARKSRARAQSWLVAWTLVGRWAHWLGAWALGVRVLGKGGRKARWAGAGYMLDGRAGAGRVLVGLAGAGEWARARLPSYLVRTSKQKMFAGFPDRPDRGTGQAGPKIPVRTSE
ncbi:hypothetical protein TIFTF001_023836 [Ficus carica]|uniref:Uncharacterized protein n=1 Tax=Ficus carica TaxID=3494 RepID=A0AA88B0B0_FICCA|nr:hypothetical protein TIFTF001_023836 [Ficus carica]